MNSLTRLVNELKSFTLNTQIQAQLTTILNHLYLENKLNVRALCNIADIKEKTLNLDELNLKFGEDYDIISGRREENEDGDDKRVVDEIHWDVVWNFEGRVNRGYAERCGFGVLQLTTNDEEFIFLKWETDAIVPLIAYQALTFGCIDRQYLDLLIQNLPELQRLNDTLREEVYRILGISDCIS